MGVMTTADEKLEQGKESIRVAYESLMEVVRPETWGHSEFTKEYIAKVEEAIIALIRIKRDL